MPKQKQKEASRIEKCLLNLKAIKDQYSLSEKAKEWKVKANMKEVTERIDVNDFRTQISSIVKRQKDAELTSAIPEFTFIPVSDEAMRNKRIVKDVFKYYWYCTNTDRVINQAIGSATTYGTWWVFEWIENIIKEVKLPYKKVTKKGVEMNFKTKTVVETKLVSRRVPFANFFINGTNIEDSTECVEVTIYDRDSYIKEKEMNSLYKDISKLKDTSKTYSIVWEVDGNDVFAVGDEDNSILELQYYNEATDEYIIEANGIEILNIPIPYKHKSLPYTPFIDNEAEDRIYGIGEFELLEMDEETMNEYRTLWVKAVKASLGFMVKERGSDLDMDDVKYGIQEVYETDDLQGFEHFSPNIDINAIVQLQRSAGDDIIAKSWIDYRSQQLNPNESATRTQSKSVTSKKRINKCLKNNAYWFYRRLAFLRMSNIQELHEMQSIRIPIEGGSIDNKWNFTKDETGSYGYANIGKNFTKGEYDILPIIETMLWDNEERRIEKVERFMKTGWNLKDEKWGSVFKWRQLGKLYVDEMWYDFDKLTEDVQSTQSAEDIIAELDWNGSSIENDPSNPNYVPPAQRKQQDQVKNMSGQAKIPIPIEES